MRYFAYGSNMYSQHLLQQVPDAKPIGIACLKGYQLFFHKLGNLDGSGKCNIVPVRNPSKVIYGVLYEISPRSRYILDKAERLGYGNHDITLKVFPVEQQENGLLKESSQGIYAFTYIAHKERVRDDLAPFTWYKDLVVAGAHEHHLPESYVDVLESCVAIQDPNPQREALHQQKLDHVVLP